MSLVSFYYIINSDYIIHSLRPSFLGDTLCVSIGLSTGDRRVNGA